MRGPPGLAGTREEVDRAGGEASGPTGRARRRPAQREGAPTGRRAGAKTGRRGNGPPRKRARAKASRADRPAGREGGTADQPSGTKGGRAGGKAGGPTSRTGRRGSECGGQDRASGLPATAHVAAPATARAGRLRRDARRHLRCARDETCGDAYGSVRGGCGGACAATAEAAPARGPRRRMRQRSRKCIGRIGHQPSHGPHRLASVLEGRSTASGEHRRAGRPPPSPVRREAPEPGTHRPWGESVQPPCGARTVGQPSGTTRPNPTANSVGG